MSNTSATGGFLIPTATVPIPDGLTLNQFLQVMLVGITGLAGTLVLPRWQVEPPKNPALELNWISFGFTVSTPDANAYIGMNPDDSTTMQRHELIELQCSLYGPLAMDYAGLIRDGFALPQNLEYLRAANMGMVETGPTQHVPDLVNGRFLNRYEMSVFLRREVIRTYPILPFVSASGVIHTVLTDPYNLPWLAEET